MVDYTARVVEPIDNGAGVWKSLRVGVFRGAGDDAEQIGEYVRNYSSLYHTFCPFQKDGKDYALYSRHYMVTSLMELPSCRNIGDEVVDRLGFCPVDFYVPSYAKRPYEGNLEFRVNNPTPEQLAVPGTNASTYYPFGFVAGCIWGDDGDWKIQYLDLSDVDKGIVRRDERFGYLAIGRDRRLRDAIDMRIYGACADEDEDAHRICITATQTFDVRNGARVHPFDW